MTCALRLEGASGLPASPMRVSRSVLLRLAASQPNGRR